MVEQAAARNGDRGLDAKIARLSARRRDGHALDQCFYADPDVFRRDVERIFLGHWLCVGHASRAAQPGDYFLFEVAGESVIIVRGRDRELRALVNVCRHRGSHVCYEASGHAKVFVCPYHAWAYELDGALRSARHMPADFDRSGHGLKKIHLRVVEGLIFINFADEPIGFDDAEKVVRASAGPYGWGTARLAHREVYEIAANWKLAVENYVECYHCAPAHPEYAKLHANEQPREKTIEVNAEMRERTAKLGIDIPEIDHWTTLAPAGEEGALCMRSAMRDGTVSGSDNGGPVAPLMGDFKDYDAGVTFFHVGVSSYFLAYPDHGLMYRFIPKTTQTSAMEVTWLVRGDAREGVDYDFDRLTWLWKVTSEADKTIIEHNQQGIDSRFYTPGPYSPMESAASRLVEWYLAEIA